MALTDDLAGVWLMAETGIRLDETANDNDLTNNNSVVRVAAPGGPETYASDFTRASGQYLSISDASQTNLDMESGSFTVQAWVRIDTHPNNLMGIVSKWQNGVNGWQLYIANSGGNPRARVIVRNGATQKVITSSNLTEGTIYHLVMRLDLGSNDLDLIIDDATPLNTFCNVSPGANTQPLVIGAYS